MKRAAVSTIKATSSACLAKVKAGEELLVMERGKPIAKLVPVPKEIDKKSTAVQLRELSRAGLVQGDPLQRGFVCLDQWLREAARREGFTVFPIRCERGGCLFC